MATARIRSIEATPLSVPLREPFVIATGSMDATRAVLVRAVLEDEVGRSDPFEGGWTVQGPRIQLTGEPGLGVTHR